MLRAFRRHRGLQLGGLLAPGILWMLLFFNVPLLIVLFISLVERGRAGGIRNPIELPSATSPISSTRCTWASSATRCGLA
jgi:hypothetical protein